MYQVLIKGQAVDARGNGKTKAELIDFIGRKLGLSERAKRSIAKEIRPKMKSTVILKNPSVKIDISYFPKF